MPKSRFSATNIRRHIDLKAQCGERSDDGENTEGANSSSASTVHYGQEPFRFFITKVMELCSAQFPNATFHIGRMRGGTYNRITVIDLTPLPPRTLSISWLRSLLVSHEEYVKAQKPKHYILRSARKQPSTNSLGMGYNVSTQRFAHMEFGDIIPQILHLDEHSRNPLSRPYTIQNRLRGQNLFNIWPDLSTNQKVRALFIVVCLMKRLHNIQSPRAGIIARLDRVEYSPNKATLDIHTFSTSHSLASASARPANGPAASMTTRQFLQYQSRRWRELEQYSEDSDEKIWDCFNTIIQSLYDMGFFPDDDKFYFCHLDLYARNMLVEVPDDSTLLLTGLLDWDAQFVHFCPKFVAYRAPFWLWVSGDQDEYDEMIAADVPLDAELHWLKSSWEDAASKEWKQYAYAPEYMIARRMFTRLRDGICRDGDKEDAMSIGDDWQALHHDQRLATAYYDDERDTEESDMTVRDSDRDAEMQLYRELGLDDIEDGENETH